MKCICCERELEPALENSHMQPNDGGEVRVSFHYGSRFDWLGYRLPVTDDNSRIVGSKPREKALSHKDRAIRLSACSHIKAVICDDCFERKSHLFFGFEEAENKLQQVVD